MTDAVEFPLVHLVSSPDLDAEIFFDLNDGFSWPEHDGFSLGAPPLLGDPGGVGAEYGLRQIQFRLIVQGDEDSALQQHSALARQLLRDVVWLRFQLSEQASSIWFRCYRSSPGEASLAEVYRERFENQWRIQMSLFAEHYALGEERSHAVTIGNDPATGGLVAVLPDIRGDFPAPLVIDLNAGDSTYIQPWISTCPLEQQRTWPGPVFWQVESGTLSNGAVVQAAPLNSSGANRVRIPVAGAAGASSTRALVQATPPFAGRWRIFVRAGFEPIVAGTVALTIRGSGSAASTPKKTVLSYKNEPTGAQFRFVDLGVYTFPKGNMPTARPYTLGPGGVGIDVAIDATDTATGSMYLDYLIAVPVDLPLDSTGPVTTLDFRQRSQTGGLVTLRVNGEEGVVQEVASLGPPPVFNVSNPEIPAGEFPMVTPGAQNVLTLLTRRTLTSTSLVDYDRIASTTTLALKYRPRFMYFADA